MSPSLPNLLQVLMVLVSATVFALVVLVWLHFFIAAYVAQVSWPMCIALHILGI